MIRFYYYVSLPAFAHQVLKCAGIRPDADHEKFFRPYFEKNGGDGRSAERGPHTVLVLAGYHGDRITIGDAGKVKRFA
jgi:hypothetical protein